MYLFNSDSQKREIFSILRVFEIMPLFATLTQGQIFEWFAVNIPMNIVPSRFTSDIDIVGCFRKRDGTKVFRTWEIKVGLVDKNGVGKSLKAGKTEDTLDQLRAYRNYGSPCVNLMDVFICEDGYLENNHFPPPMVAKVINEKAIALLKEEFGYQVMPFEHYQIDGYDQDLKVLPGINMLQTHTNITWPYITEPSGDFVLLTKHLADFFQRERAATGLTSIKATIHFCNRCKDLCLVVKHAKPICSRCNHDLYA